MKIVKELSRIEREALKVKHHSVDTYRSHILTVINQPHCFEIEVIAKDFEKIIIFLGGQNLPLAYEISLIMTNPNRLLRPPYEIGYYGGIVINHINAIQEFKGTPQEYFQKLLGCFLEDRRDGRRTYDVTDGQHRLLAYGFATKMDEKHFPINLYWGTDKSRLV
jgi:hypothetical protein